MTTMTVDRHRQIQQLHELRDQLVRAGVSTNEIDQKIRALAQPRIFEELYLVPGSADSAVTIVHLGDARQVLYVPANVQVRSIHAGNLYDADGHQPYNLMGIG